MKYIFCTLFDTNYLTRGLALYFSLVEHCPKFHLYILCMDDQALKLLEKVNLKNVTLISLARFEDKELLAVKPIRTQGEYCWTCTPSLPLYILKHFPEIKIISYLDSDIYFYSSPAPVFKEIKDSSIMIIPHRFTFGREVKEKKAGIYNVSMLTFRSDTNGLKCLEWWRKKCLEWCYNRQEAGKLGDQKYLDQFPQLFKGVHVLKHPGANVAPWNIAQYKVSTKNSVIFIDNVPLIFYHFLGLKLYSPVPFLPPVAPIGYGNPDLYRSLIYNQYFDKIYELTRFVRRFDPNFSKGFVSRPKNMIKELLADVYLRLRSNIR